MNRVLLMYPPGKAYQRGEDRAQCNLDDSCVTCVRACNDMGYSAAVLKGRGYEVMLRDYQTEKASMEAVKEDVLSFLPDIIIISTTNATVPEDIEIINRISGFHPCQFVLKGAIFFAPPHGLLETLDLNNVCCLIGTEIDTVVGEVADCISGNSDRFEEIPGIIYKKDGAFKKTRFDTWCDDLDSIPFPARSLMKNELYCRPDTGRPMATIQVARGCPSGCTFCLTPVISGKAVRKRSVDNVFEEISECYYKYGIKDFFFKADTFTIDARWAEELCDRIINSDLHKKIEFTVNSRVKPLDSSLLEKLKRAGCFTIAVGFESGNDDTLRKIKKGTTREDNIRAAELIKKSGIPLFGFFMIGFPWESREDIISNLEFVFEIDPDFLEVHIAMPYYGTELYSQCEAYNTVSRVGWGSDFFSPNTVGTQTVSMEEIQRLRNKYLLKFYLRPKYIFKKLFGAVAHPVVMLNYVKHGLKLLRVVFSKKGKKADKSLRMFL
ncbi:MAG: radical SAM protein [Clostridia bacterium]|nr:radical SAM protein [Clostridia bacterium]